MNQTQTQTNLSRKQVALVLSGALCGLSALILMLGICGVGLLHGTASWAENGTSMAATVLAAAVLAVSVGLAVNCKARRERPTRSHH